MVSAIDPTKPEDGRPAVKSDLRANLRAAKAEIEELQDLVARALAGLRSLTLGSLTSLDANGAAFTNYRAAQDMVSGVHTFAQSDSGREKIFTGTRATTWTVPSLPAGCHAIVHNFGSGEVTFMANGVRLVGLQILVPNNTAAIFWLPGGTVKLIGELR